MCSKKWPIDTSEWSNMDKEGAYIFATIFNICLPNWLDVRS
jgi:hypothetical protein